MQKTLPIDKKPFRGNLFAAHYLENNLPGGDYWKDIEERSNKAYTEIKELYKNKADFLEALDEPPLEDEFIKPILEILNHIIDVQPPIRTSVGMESKPDYAFFENEGDKRKARELRNARKIDESYKLSVGIGEAKKWSVDLDRGRKENPSVKISKYLRLSLVPWGILTNGKYWRIYSREVGFSSNLYYEIDLPSLLEHGTWEDFKYFYGFFSRQAFVKEDGSCFLDNVSNESIKFAKTLEDDLRENVYKCLKILAQGVLDSNKNLSPTKENITEIHENALILLYRFLFIFYTEARPGLLPLHKKVYWSYSIQKLRNEIAEKRDKNEPLLPRNENWNHLKLLFDLLNKGAKGIFEKIDYEQLPVPPYNGGLFNPEEYPFLEKYTINDKYLAEAIDLLSRRSGEGGRGYVDYSTLSIRHLGSIYEGLLEYKLEICEENLVEDKERGRDVYRKAEDGEKPDVYKNELYLETDKGERKATGSYYTPEYIVKYIVENTLEPIIEENAEKAKNNGDLLDDLLSIKILDPAMGSGHFLVEATNFLANKIIEKLEEAGSEDIPDLNEVKRSVAERCIYGVDLNPLATELAKVSLWLETVASDKPLSFLDHHLQCGNSLIGARFEDLVTTKDKSQVTIFSTTFNATARQMIKKRMQIEKLSSDTIENVEEKEKLLKEVAQLKERFKELLDIHTSKYFGNVVPSGEFNNLVMAIDADEKTWEVFRNREWFKKAMDCSDEKRFFNWELRFPEIFFDEYGSVKDNPGFDVVVGNPPWGAEYTKIEKKYNKKFFSDIIVRMVDSYMFFINKGKNLLKQEGYESKIVPNPFLTQSDVKKLRKSLLEGSIFNFLLNLGDGVFGPDVTAPSCIFVLKNTFRKELPNKIRVADLTNYEIPEKRRIISSRQLQYRNINQKYYLNTHNYSFITKGFEASEIINKSNKVSIPLHSLIEGKIQRGVSADYNDAFIVSNAEIIEDVLEKEKCKKVVTGHNISRFYLDYKDEYIIYLTREEDIDNFPNIKQHLEGYKHLITCKEVQGGKHPWFSLHRPRDMDIFKSPKLLGLTTSDRLIVSIDENDYFAMDNLYIIHSKFDEKLYQNYLLSLFNSRLLTFFYRYFSQEKGRILPQVKAENLYPLPIRRISFTTPNEVREKLVSELKNDYAKKDVAKILQTADSCLLKDIEKEKSDVIHDFLAFLAEQMIDMKKQQHKLENAFDLFKYLSTDIQVDEFPKLFKEEIKYARTLEGANILNEPHEVSGIWLDKEDNDWIFEVELKHRDKDNPKNFLKHGSKIKRDRYKIYAFNMDDKKGEYYLAIFKNLSEFENVKIPRGYKRRAKDKLFSSKLPVFDDTKVDAIRPYQEIWEELIELKEKIHNTDDLIDKIVYMLYGLTDEEIKIVEDAVSR